MAKKVTPRRTSAKTTQCRVRMYRQGFGDCFLLTYTGQSKPFHVMIDCGVVTTAAQGANKIRAILDDIVSATSGRVDLLIVTHEHWDHVSAFYDCADYFDGDPPRLAFDAVWVAWTEKPGDALAKEIALKEEGLGLALAAAADRLSAMAGAVSDERLERIRGFAAFSKNSDAAMKKVIELGQRRSALHYLEPGELRSDVGIPGVRAYVLGPPRSAKLIRLTDPRAGEGYESFDVTAFMEAVLRSPVDLATGLPNDQRSRPFPLDPNLRVPVTDLVARKFEVESGLKDVVKAYQADDNAWRRIDSDWLNFADSLALQVNSSINNTSLVIAFELIATGHVMLFAADAQVGSWMSWWGFQPGQRADGSEAPAGPPLRWRLPAGETSKLDKDNDGVITIDDIFRDTVLYKVGHHGSHNGTLGRYGLDRLGRPELVAMMTTNKNDAVRSGWKDIPDTVLMKHVLEAVRGRLFTSDEHFGVSDTLEPPADFPDASPTDPEWIAFQGKAEPGPDNPLVGGPLFFDFKLR